MKNKKKLKEKNFFFFENGNNFIKKNEINIFYWLHKSKFEIF